MRLETVDHVWSLMRDGEFYSPADLANILGQPIDTTVRILEFLARYKFIERMTKCELIFRKIPIGPSPAEAVTILRMLRANTTLNNASQVARASTTPRHVDRT
jgi:hypothetical protein